MHHWLIKSDPDTWNWQHQLDAPKKTTHWDGVRNHQAAIHLKAMAKGDRAFFYHSNTDKAIIGIVEIVKPAYPDPSDPQGRFVMVDVKAIKTLKSPVTLKQIKADARLADIALVRQSRLSVMPITPAQWQRIIDLSEA